MAGTTRVTVRNALGLHARPAALLVRTAAGFDAAVTVADATNGRGPVSARSLNGVATLGARQGDELLVVAEGPEAQEALAAIRRLADEGFGEPADTPVAERAQRPPATRAAGARQPRRQRVSAAPAPAGPPAPGTVLAGLSVSPGAAAGPACRLERRVPRGRAPAGRRRAGVVRAAGGTRSHGRRHPARTGVGGRPRGRAGRGHLRRPPAVPGGRGTPLSRARRRLRPPRAGRSRLGGRGRRGGGGMGRPGGPVSAREGRGPAPRRRAGPRTSRRPRYGDGHGEGRRHRRRPGPRTFRGRGPGRLVGRRHRPRRRRTDVTRGDPRSRPRPAGGGGRRRRAPRGPRRDVADPGRGRRHGHGGAAARSRGGDRAAARATDPRRRGRPASRPRRPQSPSTASRCVWRPTSPGRRTCRPLWRPGPTASGCCARSSCSCPRRPCRERTSRPPPTRPWRTRSAAAP